MSSPNCERVILSDPHLMTGRWASWAVIAHWIWKYWHNMKYQHILFQLWAYMTRTKIMFRRLHFIFFLAFVNQKFDIVSVFSLWCYKVFVFELHLCSHTMCCGLDWVSLTLILLFIVTPSLWLSQESKPTSLVTSEDEGVLFSQWKLQRFHCYPFGPKQLRPMSAPGE